MDLKELKKLISLMNENGLSRLEVSEGDRRFLLEKGGAAAVTWTPSPAQALAGPPMTNGFGTTPAPATSVDAATRVPQENTKTFNSPMVGTFYRRPTPESEPFVKPGDRVTPETVICLIEAMKVFNEVRAEMSGTIVEVLAEDREAVEYNQPLYLIRPA